MKSKAAFTLVELLVVISIVAVLIATLLPAIAKAKDTTLSIRCMTNLRQLGVADQCYRNDYNSWFVDGNIFVGELAKYTNTPKQYYLWQGYGYSSDLYAKADPFKCPLVRVNTEYDGPYGKGVGTLSAGGVTDFGYGTALHFSDPNSSNPNLRMRKDSALTHTPATVLNYSDAKGGVLRIDYSTFAVWFRHNQWETAPLLYVDNHATMVKETLTTFSRGSNNTVWDPDRPYFWW